MISTTIDSWKCRGERESLGGRSRDGCQARLPCEGDTHNVFGTGIRASLALTEGKKSQI